MKTTCTCATTLLLAASLALPAVGQELLTNPTFDGPPVGDGWGSFGAAGFHSFFGPNGHASLFSDNPGNFGGIFQTGIAGSAGTEYLFQLLDVRLESNIDADLRFGLEYFAADDATKLGDTLVPIDLSTTGDGLSFSMTATALAGTAFVRPIIQFDNVRSTASGQENAFIFDASLTVVPEPAALGTLALGGLALIRRSR
jgi:MYXO-CTERM domain-containing protein